MLYSFIPAIFADLRSRFLKYHASPYLSVNPYIGLKISSLLTFKVSHSVTLLVRLQ